VHRREGGVHSEPYRAPPWPNSVAPMGSAGQRGALSILLASVWLKGAVVAVSPPRRGVVGEAERATVSLPAAASPPAPLSFALNNTINSRTRSVISADARALYVDGEPWYPVSGEIHYARVPAAQWEEALLRMKAGGVDTLSVYVFWIHHEELEGQFDFSGRRDIRHFMQLAAACGLKVMLRAGPWCHGEVRNGGHPDWLQAMGSQFKLRQKDPQYLSYVSRFFAQLGAQLEGLWWSDGGPIVWCQLENETGDWQYLLALKDIASRHGFAPVAFARTGWPAPYSPKATPGHPALPVPADLPLLPFFSGCETSSFDSTSQPARVSQPRSSHHSIMSLPCCLARAWVQILTTTGRMRWSRHRSTLQSTLRWKAATYSATRKSLPRQCGEASTVCRR